MIVHPYLARVEKGQESRFPRGGNKQRKRERAHARKEIEWVKAVSKGFQ